MPTPQPFPRITASPIEIEYWFLIQAALGQKLLYNLAPDEYVCEWEILGREGQATYVWATCSSLEAFGQINPLPYAASMPAVIWMNPDGTVESIEIPGIGNQYAGSIRALFPADVQTIIFDHLIDYTRLDRRLEWRLEHPDEPPLIVIEAAPAS